MRGNFPDVPSERQTCVSWSRTLFTSLYNIKLLDIAKRLGESDGEDGEMGNSSGEEDLFWSKETLRHVMKCFQGYAIVENSLQACEQVKCLT